MNIRSPDSQSHCRVRRRIFVFGSGDSEIGATFLASWRCAVCYDHGGVRHGYCRAQNSGRKAQAKGPSTPRHPAAAGRLVRTTGVTLSGTRVPSAAGKARVLRAINRARPFIGRRGLCRFSGSNSSVFESGPAPRRDASSTMHHRVHGQNAAAHVQRALGHARHGRRRCLQASVDTLARHCGPTPWPRLRRL